MALNNLNNKIFLLNQTVLECMGVSSEQTIIKKFIDAGLNVLGADYGYGYLLTGDKKSFHLLYKSASTPYSPQIPRKGGTIASAFRSKAPKLIEDIEKDSTIRGDAKGYMRGVAVIPMSYKKNNYGALVICYQKIHRFTPEQAVLADFIGNSAAQAITINRLYSDLQDFKSTLDTTLDSIFMFDPRTLRIVYANKGAIRQLGYKKPELLRKNILDIQHGFSDASFREIMEPLLHRNLPSLIFETVLRGRDKSKIPVEIFMQHITATDQPDRFVCIVRDITERKHAEETIKHTAYHDALTTLPNRIFFSERLNVAYERAQKHQRMFGILFLDLDRFKFINDILGHVAGDKLLFQAAQRLKEGVKKSDIVSRMGGDEFIILLQDIKKESDAVDVAERILQLFKAPFDLDGQEIYVNISIGISIYPKEGNDLNSLLKNADNALYRAKQQGGNSYQQYHVGISIPQIATMELEKQLRQALKRGELILHYQPEVDLNTGSIVRAEALVRWQHPRLGLILPSEFISQAEESGLIVQLGDWVLKEVCRQIAAWKKSGLRSIPISINLSPRQLIQQSLVKSVREALKSNGIESRLVELELTESVLIQNIDLSVEILEQFKKMGMKIIIDDFGTGYASLSYLKKLPVDIVKIDHSFIHGIGKSPDDEALIRAMLSISQQMHLATIAEGVETLEQLQFLRHMHCDIIQGNLYSKPLPVGEFEELLRRPPTLFSRSHANLPLN